MNKTTFLAIVSISILLMAISAQGQPISGQTYMDSQYAIEIYPPDQQLLSSQSPGIYQDQVSYEGKAALQTDIRYSSTVPSGAPTPFAPTSPDSLGLQIPTESSATYSQVPPSSETGRALIPASSASVGQMTKEVLSTQYNYPESSTAVSTAIRARNKLYVSFVPQTVAGCGLFGWQPLWLQTSSIGPIWFYEWYPNGQLSVNYLGVSSAGWQKKWFYGDTPGWHILQYYSQGWSNYIYIYVYGGGSGYWTNQGPYSGTATSTPSYSGTSAVTLRSSWFKGYDVYLDGEYVGTEGYGSDPLDGVYNFRVPGGMWHTIVISKDGQSYDETGTFVSGASYRFTI